jgi:hypothetical protein
LALSPSLETFTPDGSPSGVLFFQLLNGQTPVPHSGFPESAIGKLQCEAGAQLATSNLVSTIPVMARCLIQDSFVLSAFSLAKEDQINENAQHHGGHDYLLQVFRIKAPRRNCARCDSTMTAMMIDDGKRITADGARLQWHMIPIADIDLIARNTRGEEMGCV